jgi:hypothetical protein
MYLAGKFLGFYQYIGALVNRKTKSTRWEDENDSRRCRSAEEDQRNIFYPEHRAVGDSDDGKDIVGFTGLPVSS